MFFGFSWRIPILKFGSFVWSKLTERQTRLLRGVYLYRRHNTPPPPTAPPLSSDKHGREYRRGRKSGHEDGGSASGG